VVDDEGPVLGHDRDFPEVDLLLLDVPDGLGSLAVVPGDQADGHLERRGVGHAPLQALLDVVLRLLERVPDELQRCRVVEILDREYGIEDGLKPDVLALLGLHIGLKEALEGLLLDLDQVGNLENRRNLRKALPKAQFPIGDGDLGHALPSPTGVASIERRTNRTAFSARSAGARIVT
jgi:hypothetical protein